MSYSYYFSIYHYLRDEYYSVGQLSHTCWLQGDHGMRVYEQLHFL